jgi:hypothetical protein
MHVFLSYSRRDGKVATEVVARLEGAGHEVWRDVESIAGGSAWRASIERGIRSTDAFILLMSPSVARSPRYPGEELDFARSADKPIIPVYLKAVATLPDGFGLTLGGIERINLYPSFEAGMTNLLSVLGPVATPASSSDGEQPQLRDWATSRLAGMKSKVNKLRMEAKQRELGAKTLKLAGAVAAVGAAAAVATSKARSAEAEKTAARDSEAREQARVNYRERAADLLAGFTLEYSRSQDEITVEAYQEEFRPRFWHLLGQLEGLEPPVELRSAHADFVGKMNDSLTNLDDAFRQLRHGEAERANRAYQRSVERLLETFKSFITLLEASEPG